MKIVSAIIIIAYLMLPAICFGHPCEMNSQKSLHGTIASNAAGECPFDYGTDFCETTCCCAGHVPLSARVTIPYVVLIERQVPCEPRLALPRLLDRIVVPPENIS
jgi:hypothetical protein